MGLKDSDLETIIVASGEETLNGGVDYNSFKIPSFIYKTSQRPGETIEQAAERATEFVMKLKRKVYVEHRDIYIEHVADSRRAVREAKIPR